MALNRWRDHGFLSAHLSHGGDLWATKGQAGVLDDVRVDVALHQDRVSHHPFGAPELRSWFRVQELSSWRDDGEVLQRLEVQRPQHLASHSSRQTLYFDNAVRLARHDYQVEIIAGAAAAHLFDGFVSIDGIIMPTRHRIHPRDTAGRVDTSSVIVAIDVDDLAFTQP